MAIESSKALDTVIFDLGAVLVDWDPQYLYRKIFDDESEMQYFLQNICTSEWNAQQDAGRSWKEATQLLLDQHPKYHDQIVAFSERWVEMLNGPISGSVAILKRIKEEGKYRLLALTNWSDETWPHALERYDFLNLFEGIVVSGKEKVKKPDSRIYHILLDRYKVNPEKAIFIDDSLPNVEAARALSIQAIHFTSSDQLARDLSDAGII